MKSEISYPVHCIEYESPKDITNPFFLTAPIPFPDVDPNKRDDLILQDLQNNWSLAEDDFIAMYNSEEFGKPLRDFFQEDIESGEYTLPEIGELVGLTNADRARKTRSALQIGTTNKHTDVTFWRFSEVEMAQLMVGFIGRKFRNLYTRINLNSLKSDS